MPKSVNYIVLISVYLILISIQYCNFLEFSRFYQLENVASSARVEYKLIVDGKWITDSLNPNKVDNGVGGENSFFTMPEYKPTT